MALFLLPVTPGVLLPVEIIDALVRIGTVDVPDVLGQVTLMDLDGHESLDLCSDELGFNIFQAHGGKIVQVRGNLLQFPVEFVSPVLDAGTLKSFSHLRSPDHLNTKE
jgi:hypothetical protein